MFPTIDLNVLIVGNVLLFGNFSVFGKLLLLLSKKIDFCVSREIILEENMRITDV